MYKKFLRTLRVLAAALVIHVISAPLAECSDAGRLSALMSEWVTAERDRARCVPLARARGIDTDNLESQCPRCQRRLWKPAVGYYGPVEPNGNGYGWVNVPAHKLPVDWVCARWMDEFKMDSMGPEINSQMRVRNDGAPSISWLIGHAGSYWGGFESDLLKWARYHDEHTSATTKE
jgi:hypothetical protein